MPTRRAAPFTEAGGLHYVGADGKVWVRFQPGKEGREGIPSRINDLPNSALAAHASSRQRFHFHTQ